MPESTLERRLRAAGASAGLSTMGFAAAEPFLDAREVLEARKAEGLHGGMQFTYRNPERSTTPARILDGARSLVVGALAYRREEPDDQPAHAGRVARYAWADYYEQLRGALAHVVSELESGGHRATVVLDDNALVDRQAAYRAGLGWFGKNANILLPQHGSWFVLGSIVTDAHLTPATPVPDGCGSCTRCTTACPTDAIVAPGVVDASRCLAWLVQDGGVFPRAHRRALADRIYGCDTCQEVCPPNRLEERRSPSIPASSDARPYRPLLDLLSMDDDALLADVGRWYIAGRDPNVVRRNAVIALGNTADNADAEVRVALEAALHNTSELVRAHAVWACGELGMTDLLAAIETDPSALVQTELHELRVAG